VRVGAVVRLLPTLALGVALVLVVLLAQQSRSLRQELVRLRLEARTPPLGLPVPKVGGLSLSGDSITIGPSASGQIVLLFNTECAFCRRTLPQWRLIASRTRDAAPGLDVVGLTLDNPLSVRTYVEQHAIDFNVLLLSDSSTPLLYWANVVPLTMVLGASGRVLFSRAGTLTPIAVDSIVAIALTAGSSQ
jgi:hypothetical protein